MSHTQPTNTNGLRATVILGVLFFIFGFITWLNGTLIPYLRIACELTTFESLLVTFAFYISYFVMAMPSSALLKLTGFKKGMSIGLFIMSLGAILFIPAAMTRTYWLFLTGLFVIGTGLSVLQTASNPYVTIVGPIESAARRISIMGICNKVAGILAPVILGAVVLSDADVLVKELQTMDITQKNIRLNELAHRVILPYSLMALALSVLAMLLRFSPLPEIDEEEDEVQVDKTDERTSILQFPNLVLGVVALFLYVGAEVVAADTIGTYGLSQGIALSEAKNFTAYTLSAMLLGYVIGIFAIPRYMTQARALGYSAITGVIFSLLATQTEGYISVFFIAMLGLSNALMWPAIWPLAIDGTRRFTKIASALLIMAIAGGALLPLAYGSLADLDIIGPQQAYWILIPCYLFILHYSIYGYKLHKWKF